MHSIWAFCNVCNIQDWLNIDGLVQERCNSIANAMELHLSYTNQLIWYIDSLVQDCSNSSAWAMELLQSCAKKNDRKMLSYKYSDSHYKDKMIVRLSYIHMGFTSHVAALYQIRAFKFIQCFFFPIGPPTLVAITGTTILMPYLLSQAFAIYVEIRHP